MIKIENTWVGGFENAIRGMRMPYESFDKSDSVFYPCDFREGECDSCRFRDIPCNITQVKIGPDDMALCKKLIKAGSEHRKFLRMIHVQAEVKAPRYFWQEADKYKFIEANSSSTMHLITKRKLTANDFSIDKPLPPCMRDTVNTINILIDDYNKDKWSAEAKKTFLISIKQLLPESYNQLRMIDTNYECLLSIYHQRKNHRLSEWHTFCDWIKSLPYMEEFLEAME